MGERARSAGSLPAELTTFVGRRGELAEIKRLLASSRLVTLTGSGGVGKTKLGIRVGSGLRRAFPDGVWFVRLAEVRDPALLATSIAAELGLRGESSSQVSSLAEYLADKRVLLILDNCEHLVDACAALVGKLLAAADWLRILATSRQRLGTEGEQVLTVLPLPVAPGGAEVVSWGGESSTLFVERAAAVQPGFQLSPDNREAVNRICQRLDGIPLAIELAAVLMRVLTPEQLLRRLDDRFSLLVTGSRTAPPHQQTLAAAIDWSYNLCTPEEQAVWRAASVFSGSFDLDAAEAVCTEEGIARGDILRLIAALMDKSVLARRTGGYGRTAWYEMLETVRDYGLRKLVEAGDEERVRSRHVEYYRLLAEQFLAEFFGRREVDWIQRLTGERANLRGVLQYCLEDPSRVRYATEIASQLWHFWYAAGLVPEGRHWLTEALARDTEPTPARARALEVCASMTLNLFHVGGADDVEVMLAELGTLAELFDDDLLHAGLLRCSGMRRFFAGELAGAREQLEEALRRYETAGDETQVCTTLVALSVVTFFLADPAGEDHANRALSMCETRQATWSRNYVLWAVAVYAWRRGDHQRAAARLREAIATWFSDRTQLVYALTALAWCADAAGEYERVAGLLGAARSVWRLSGARVGEPSPFQVFDEQCAERARSALGEEAYATAFEMTTGVGVDEAIAYALGEKPAPRPQASGHHARMPGGLTRREWEVAALVAEGLSNREIAAKLVISPRTAEAHVEKILVKLSFTSRAQVAAWLAEQRSDG